MWWMATMLMTPAPTEIYVSPTGNDGWGGRIAAPNRARNDGPKATLEAAYEVAKASGGPVTIWVRGGTYRITKPIRLSGGLKGSATIANYRNERPVFSGGRVLQGALADGTWEAQLAPGERVEDLWVNGVRRYRPRVQGPNGYFEIPETAPLPSGTTLPDRMAFVPGTLRADWANRGDVEVLVFHSWTTSRNRIAEFGDGVVRFASPSWTDQWYAQYAKGFRYYAENVKEAFGKPGEWYFDRPTGLLQYKPPPGETVREVVVPVADRLLELDGANNLTLRGLHFRHTRWLLPEKGRHFAQAEADLAGAVRINNSRDVRLEGVTVAQTGEYGLEIGTACQNITIVRCAFSDLGAGGIKVGEMAVPGGELDPAKNPQLTARVTLEDNQILNGGRRHPAGVGVWIGQNPEIVVRRNRIADFYYTGVSVGWSWGYQPNGAARNTIEGNWISDIGQGVLSDMGGIYTLGPQAGTVLRSNRIHDIKSFAYGGWGIYPDEGSTAILVENNVVYRTKSAGFHQHYGKENVIRNNVFAFAKEAMIMRTRAEDHLSFTFEQNIVLFDEGTPLLGSNWSGDRFRLDQNLYWRRDGKPFDFAGMTFAQWQAKGQDKGSIVADPLFVNPDRGNFTLRPGSPAVKIGFRPIDLSQSGPTWQPRGLPNAPSAFPDPLPRLWATRRR